MGKQALSGGCICRSWKIENGRESIFRKELSEDFALHLFQCEANALKVLKEKSLIHVPKVLRVGIKSKVAFLELEYLEAGIPSKNYWEDFGRNLAKMHKVSWEKGFGFFEDNYIATLTQPNIPCDSWYNFYANARIKPRLNALLKREVMPKKLEQDLLTLCKKLGELFPIEASSLLHGDLWNGNVGIDQVGNATIFDPSTFYGFREMDLAMSRLFGGFSQQFYDAYQEEYPLEKGWKERIDLCNLYPLLVHAELFGSSYLERVQEIVKRYV